MSFRIEEKILVNKNQILDFQKFCLNISAKKLYETRIIKSLYLDNNNSDMFTDSVEGVLPRKKIRIRQYPENKLQEFFFEEKISSVEGRFKKRKKITKNNFTKIKKTGYLDNIYGNCKPLVYVEYKRKYLHLNKVRITHDTDIKYYLFSKKLIRYDENQIFEIKANYKTDIDELQLVYPMTKSRFSKYCNAVENFFN